MAELSSYLRHLPPVLWQDEPAPPGFSLGTALRIFEKVLTGIDDDVDVRHGDHTHPAVAWRCWYSFHVGCPCRVGKTRPTQEARYGRNSRRGTSTSSARRPRRSRASSVSAGCATA